MTRSSTFAIARLATRRSAALAAAFVGLVNIGSTLTPNIRWRGHLLLEYEPVQAMRLFHALALPAGAALLLVAPYLLKRRRRAWQAAVVLMLALGLFDLLKGLDFEETMLTLGGRRGAGVRPGRVQRQRTTRSRFAPRCGASRSWGWWALPSAAVATWATEGHPSWGTRDARDVRPPSAGHAGPIHYHHSLVPLGVHMLEAGDAVLDRVCRVPPARGAQGAPRPGRPRGRCPTWSARTARHARRSSTSAATSSICSARTCGRSSATGSRPACYCCRETVGTKTRSRAAHQLRAFAGASGAGSARTAPASGCAGGTSCSG